MNGRKRLVLIWRFKYVCVAIENLLIDRVKTNRVHQAITVPILLPANLI